MVDRLASRRADVVVAVSEKLATQLQQIVYRPERVIVIQNGVDTESYHPDPDDQLLRRELRIAPDAPIIGSIGRLQEIKGYDVMVQAFARLARMWTAEPRPVLILVGDGAQRAALERAAQMAEGGDAIHFLGWRSDISTCHRSFALFTMSSRSEGTSVSLLEAMSAGLCPVVTNVGGNAAVLGEELHHRLVPSEDPEALADAWMDALTDTGRRVVDAEIARERVVRGFSLEAMVRKYEAVYTRDKEYHNLFDTLVNTGARC
jgi:glycosyltransferase involved in cell wall biosynthesis